MIPGEFNVQFNLRFSTELNNDTIVQRVTETLDKHDLNYDLHWTFNGDPFLTDTGALLDAVVAAVAEVNNTKPALLTTGGRQTDVSLLVWAVKLLSLGLSMPRFTK